MKMALDAFAAELSRMMQCRVQAPFNASDPVRVLNFTDGCVLVSKRVGNVACITTVRLVRPPAMSTEGITSAYEIALTKAINETQSERTVGSDLFVSMDAAGACAAAAHVSGTLRRSTGYLGTSTLQVAVDAPSAIGCSSPRA